MAIRDERELFVYLLSDLRQSAQRAPKIFREIADATEDSDVKEALQARIIVSIKIIATLDEAFNLIGAVPVEARVPFREVSALDFRRELAEIVSPEARRLFILVRTHHVVHRRIGEYVALITAADVAEQPGVRVLLESCLSDNIAFIETTRRLMLGRARPAPLAA